MGDATRLSECCLEADEATQHVRPDFTVGKSRIRCPSPLVVMRWTDDLWAELCMELGAGVEMRIPCTWQNLELPLTCAL